MNYDLVILDPHVTVGAHLDRFKWLNNMVRGSPEVENIICIGDYASMDCLSGHSQPGSKTDNAKPSLREEFEHIRESQKILFDKVKVPVSNRILTKGNHEYRFDRWAENNPGIASAIDYNEATEFRKYWGTIKGYGGYVSVNGIDYTHVPFNLMGRPISGVNRTRTIAMQSSKSTIFGHSHNMQFSSVPLIGSKNAVRCALSGPAFQDQDHLPDYAKNTQAGWNYGVLKVFPLGKNRGFSFHWISMKELEDNYG